jgi:hypothetical protein
MSGKIRDGVPSSTQRCRVVRRPPLKHAPQIVGAFEVKIIVAVRGTIVRWDVMDPRFRYPHQRYADYHDDFRSEGSLRTMVCESHSQISGAAAGGWRDSGNDDRAALV